MRTLEAVNLLDRFLAYAQATTSAPPIGDTLFQGVNMPQVFFVDSGVGNDGNDGRNPREPLASLAGAFDKVSANRGDIVFIMPGHTETVTTSVSLDVAGVTVIGLGSGAARPTFTVGDGTGDTIALDAASITLFNLLFIPGIDSLAILLDVNKPDCVIEECEFREATSIQALTMIDINGGAANACDRTKIINCKFKEAAAGANQAIELGEVADSVVIDGCVAWGDYANACIHNPTSKVLTNLTIKDCDLTNLQTGDHSIELVSACTGNLIRNTYHNDMTQATGVDPGSCFSYQCYHDDVVDTSGIITPAVT